jgi:hypothetical protein
LVKQMLRPILWLSVVALGVLAQPSLHAQLPANAVPVKTYTGYYNDQAVYFSAFETNSANFAGVNGLVYAPRLGNANGAGVANMIFFSGGPAGQTVVLQTQPGQPDYSPIWHVIVAAWRGPGTMPLITSYNAALQWWQSGRLLLQSTGIVFNGPVIVINRQISTGAGGNLAPTLSPNEFLGLNPATRTAYFVGHQGYAGGQVVTFLALEHAPGVISMAPGAMPVPTIDLNHLGHAAIANFFVPPGQLPLLDSYPTQMVSNPGTTTPSPVYGGGAGTAGKGSTTPPPPVQGTGQTGQQPAGGTTTGQSPSTYGTTGSTGQMPVEGAFGAAATSQLPAYSLPPFQGLYSPIWHVHPVTFLTGGTGQPLTSLQGLAAVLSSGLAVQTDGGVQDTFNCPIVALGVAYVPPPGGTGGTTTGTTTGTTGYTGTTGTTGTTGYTGTTGTTGYTGTTGTTGTTGYTGTTGTTGTTGYTGTTGTTGTTGYTGTCGTTTGNPVYTPPTGTTGY